MLIIFSVYKTSQVAVWGFLPSTVSCWFIKQLHSLQLTASLHLKINGWKMKFPFGIPYFQGRAVSFGRVQDQDLCSIFSGFALCPFLVGLSIDLRGLKWWKRFQRTDSQSIWETKPYFPTKGQKTQQRMSQKKTGWRKYALWRQMSFDMFFRVCSSHTNVESFMGETTIFPSLLHAW